MATNADQPTSATDDEETIEATFSNEIIYKEVTCAAERFNKIGRTMWLVYYLMGTIQVALSTFMTLVRVNGMETDLPEALRLACDFTSTFFAILIIFIPISPTAKACKNAYSLCASYALTQEPIPIQVISNLMECPTLCLKHPFAYRDCLLADSYYLYKPQNDDTVAKKSTTIATIPL